MNSVSNTISLEDVVVPGSCLGGGLAATSSKSDGFLGRSTGAGDTRADLEKATEGQAAPEQQEKNTAREHSSMVMVPAATTPSGLTPVEEPERTLHFKPRVPSPSDEKINKFLSELIAKEMAELAAEGEENRENPLTSFAAVPSATEMSVMGPTELGESSPPSAAVYRPAIRRGGRVARWRQTTTKFGRRLLRAAITCISPANY